MPAPTPETPVEALPRAFPAPGCGAVLRACPEDFVVEERLGYEPEGDGPHVWLRVEKRDVNTAWVAGELARLAGVRRLDVGYAGLKDRFAVTTQWFSIDDSRAERRDWCSLRGDGFKVVAVTRHRKKLRRGALAGNRFRITLRGLTGDVEALPERVRLVAERGFPNYFGPQRFGRNGDNVRQARTLFEEGRRVRSRHLRGLYLSAARSFLFNRVLAVRVAEGTWSTCIEGDAVIADGGRRPFRAAGSEEAAAGTLEQALASLRVHPTGPLWGRGPSPATGAAAALEEAALADLALWREGLEGAGLVHERRALRARAGDLEGRLDGSPKGDGAVLEFELPRGVYATALLRELVTTAP